MGARERKGKKMQIDFIKFFFLISKFYSTYKILRFFFFSNRDLNQIFMFMFVMCVC